MMILMMMIIMMIMIIMMMMIIKMMMIGEMRNISYHISIEYVTLFSVCFFTLPNSPVQYGLFSLFFKLKSFSFIPFLLP